MASGPLVSTPPSIVTLDPHIRIPYSIQYSSGVEREVTKGKSLAVNYVRTVFVGSFLSRDINAPLPPLYAVRPDPAFGQIRQIESAGRDVSNALEATLRGNVTRYFTGMAEYTLSKAMSKHGRHRMVPGGQLHHGRGMGARRFRPAASPEFARKYHSGKVVQPRRAAGQFTLALH